MEYVKGPRTLIEPFRAWNQARLVLVGSGSQEMSLRAAAAGSDRTQPIGRVPGEDRRRLNRNAVALIVSSFTYELFVGDHRSLPEPVLDSSGGLPYSTSEELIAQAGRLPWHRRLRDEPGARGRDAMLTRWSAETRMGPYPDKIDGLSRTGERIA